MVQLFGDPFNLQGGANPQQAANPQATANPQQTYGPTPAPIAPKTVVAAPKAVTPAYTAPKPVAPTAQPTAINPALSQYVQTRPSPSNPGVLEYYNPANGKGFTNPQDVFNYLLTMTGHQYNDLNQLSAPQGGNSFSSIPFQTPTDPNQQFAQLAAQAGLSVDDYIKYVSGKVSPDERNGINAGLGIPDLQNQLFAPAPKTQDLYNQAYASAGLGDLKAKIDAKLAEVNQRQQQYTDKAGTVNENPFLSEASRTGRLRTLDDKRLADIGNLNAEVKSLADLYNNGIVEVNGVVSRTTTDFSNNQQVNAYKLQVLQQQAEQQLNDLQSKKTATATQYLPDYLKAKAKAQKPDTIGSNETGFYQWNPTTGTFTQVIAPSVTPNFQANPLTGELFNTKTGLTGGGGAGNTIASLAALVTGNPEAYSNLTSAQQAAVNNYLAQNGQALPGKPATDAQNQSAGYVTRIQQASQVIDTLESAIAGYNALGFQAQLKLPSYLQSTEIQQYQQAALNLIGAKLRKESGAAISQTEYDNAYAQYLPRAGDSAAVLAQKRQNRATILQGEIQNAGPAYKGGNASTGSTNDPLGLFSSAGNASASTPYLKTLGRITGENGSSLWSYGLDVDLKKGDPVRSPVSGTVIAAAPNGGFGNQVKIRTADGQEVWLSHLDSGQVKVGQVVNAGQIIGIGGNTGNTIALKGGDGSHLDITMKDANGKLLTAPQVHSFLNNIYV